MPNLLISGYEHETPNSPTMFLRRCKETPGKTMCQYASDDHGNDFLPSSSSTESLNVPTPSMHECGHDDDDFSRTTDDTKVGTSSRATKNDDKKNEFLSDDTKSLCDYEYGTSTSASFNGNKYMKYGSPFLVTAC